MSDVIVGREGVARHRWTVGSDWPAAGSLYVGEIAVGLADPMMLWVGVPTSLDPSGIRLLYDAQNAIDAPADGQVYGRRGSTSTWQAVLPITGGTLTGPLVVPNGTIAAPGLQFGAADGTGISRASNALVLSIQGSTILGMFAGSAQFYGPLSMLGNKIVQLADATAASDALNMRTADARYATPANIPLASTQPPLMDSVASPGSSAAWSAGDHVHPSDTAKLSLTGGTMSGGIGFGASIGNTPLDFSHHINLWGSQYGISITSNRLNIVAGSNIVMVVGNNTDIGTFSPGGLFMSGTNTVTLGADPTTAMQAATKQYVDTKAGNYVPLTGGVMSGGLSFGSAVAASTIDLSRHVTLFAPGYGMNVTASRLNLVSPGSTTLFYVNNGNDVFRVGPVGQVQFGYTGNTLLLTPNDGARSGNISFVAAATNSILEFDNPIFLPGIATGVAIGPAIWLGNSSHQIRGNAGQDGASMAVANYSLNSWNGIGFGPNISGMNIPQWMYGLVINTRAGSVINYGDFYALNALPNAYSTIQHISIVKSGFDQIFQLDGNALVATLPSATPVAGGSGCNVNDRFYDAYNNTYTATAVTAGAVTAIALNAATARFGGVPANPVTLTAAPGFSGTGVQVNLTWAAPTRFVIRAAGGSQSMLLSAAGGITAGNPITLPADPTTALQAATKQYVDAFLRLAGGTMTGALTLAADPASAMQAATKQYVDLHAAGLTEAPVDGFGYGRLNAAWAQVLPLTGGQLSGNLGVGRPIPALINTTTQCGVVTGQVVAGSFTWNAYVDTAGAWRYRNANAALFFGSFGTLTGIAAAVSGAADALVTWGPAFQVDARGNVGLSMTPPAGQSIAGSSGGWMFGWGATFANWGSNLYYGADSQWHYLSANPCSYLQQINGVFYWTSAPSGAAGAVATLPVRMSLDLSGNLVVNGNLNTAGNFSTASINATGAITAGSDILGASGVYAARATASNFVLYGSSSNLYHQYETGWYWTWNRSSGALYWVGNGGTTFATFDAGGGLTMAGGLSVAANANISGNMVVGGYINTQNYIMNASGIFYVANNTAYYMGRNSSDGAWRFVEGGTTNSTLDTGGNLTTRGSVAAGGGLSCMSGSFWIGPGASGRVINIASQWYWEWNGSNGDLWWQTASGAFIGFAISSALLVNNLGPVGGSGAYQDYSDVRGKQNIADAEHGLAEILQLRPVTFSRIPRSAGPEPKPDLGFIAQEVQGVLPEAVHVMGLVLPDGSGGRDSADPTLGVSTTPIVAAMVNAIKELAARVEMLEAA